ncbi:MAG: ABC transporter ATP-binding protein [Verrucomicrobia bacterium]|nr:ABC transporter ATP-binding protein [Verrucomicrobiota bacterium]
MSCLVEVHHLRYAYPGGPEVLRDISFHLGHGERVGLVGPNGVGKTTLLLILAGVIEQFSGDVSVAGCDLATRAGRRSVHRKLGFVFQHTDDQLINATVHEDVAFGPLNLGLPPEEAQRRVAAAMASVGLGDNYRSRIPFHLSAGEKRRVAIAGVMAMQPEIVLMDEPTSDLDPRGRRELVRILAELPVTRIISSHNLEFVLETCDRVLLLDEGRLRADGPVRRVLADEALMLQHGLEVPPSIPPSERAAAAVAGPLPLPHHSHEHHHHH